jgi:hypothetical protein
MSPEQQSCVTPELRRVSLEGLTYRTSQVIGNQFTADYALKAQHAPAPQPAHKARKENGMKNCNALGNQTMRRILSIACATALAVAFTGALPQPARADPIAYELMLVNAKTGKCLTNAGGVSTDNNVTALQFNCDTDLSRRRTIRLKL